MAVSVDAIQYVCDWTNENGDICGESESFSGDGHERKARDAGWGAYSNAYIRRERWTTGAELWFCPVHATVFRKNHGWGGLESYKPPTQWWANIFKKR